MDIEQLKEQLLSDPEVRRMVGRRAHEIYLERRGTRAAHPAEDWLRAESEILPRLIEHMIEHNRQAMESPDDSDPVSTRAAAHFEEELQLAETGVGAASHDAKAGKQELLDQNVERLAAETEEATATVPNAPGVLAKKPVKKTAAKKAPAKTAPATKAAATKSPAKKAAAKPPVAKASAKKAPAAKAPAKKAAAKPKKKAD